MKSDGRTVLLMVVLCGWVLWNYMVAGPTPVTSSGWQVLDAYESLADCKADIEVRSKTFRATVPKGEEHTVLGNIFTNIYTDDEGNPRMAVNRLQCLPGTLDPREHKGGER